MRIPITIALLALAASPVAADDWDEECGEEEDDDECDEAEPGVTDDWVPEPAAPLHVDLAIGVLDLVHGVDDFTGDLEGFYLDAGVRRGRLFLFATYQRASGAALDDPERNGRFERGALNVRYDRSALYLPLGPVRILLGPFLEGGAGYEWMRWDEGGRIARPDLSFAVGGTIRTSRRHKGVGIELGVRFVLAPAFETDAMAGCQGPCYEASPPPAADLGAMLFAGFPLSP